MKKINPTSFGNSAAAITLVTILSELEDANLVAKIGRKLSMFNHTLKELTKVDTDIRIKLAKLVYDSSLEPTNISGSVPMPENVTTFVNNLLATRFRIWMVENAGTTPKKIRIENQN